MTKNWPKVKNKFDKTNKYRRPGDRVPHLCRFRCEIDEVLFMPPAPCKRKCVNCPAQNRNVCPKNGTRKLSSYRPGEKGIVSQVCGNPDFRLRMMELGFVRGAAVKVVKYAPLFDPIELEIKGYHVSLRRDQASDILMDLPEKAA